VKNLPSSNLVKLGRIELFSHRLEACINLCQVILERVYAVLPDLKVQLPLEAGDQDKKVEKLDIFRIRSYPIGILIQ